ncbi:MAG: helix-turn-helix domain-containing protein [Xanthobacteraceae bacterium]|nr:helix-turn-helix domain-containing protein [Xanthobacteraceae bacterium]
MKLLDIAEVSRQSGIAASALRFYEEKGLIRSVGRRGLKRLFEPKVLEQLGLIALGRAAGFSLEEITSMLAPAGKLKISRDRLAAKAEELDSDIRHLIAMRNGLRHAAKCSAPSHMECPTFRKLIRAAASGLLAPEGKKANTKRVRARSH